MAIYCFRKLVHRIMRKDLEFRDPSRHENEYRQIGEHQYCPYVFIFSKPRIKIHYN